MPSVTLPDGLTVRYDPSEVRVSTSVDPIEGRVAVRAGELVPETVRFGDMTGTIGLPDYSWLLAEAVLWLDGTDLPEDWEPADGFTNKGTGIGIDGYLVTVNPKPGGGAKEIAAEDVATAITKVAGGVEIEWDPADPGDQKVAASFAVPDDPQIEMDGTTSGMWTLDWTLGDLDFASSQKFLDWYEGPNIPDADNPSDPAVGGVLEWIDNVGGGAGSGGVLAGFNDDTLPNGAAVFTFPRPDMGDRVRYSMRFDRTAGFYAAWHNGVKLGEVDIDDLSGFGGSGALGSLAGACTPFVGNHMVFHHLHFHPAGTAAYNNPALLHAALGL